MGRRRAPLKFAARAGNAVRESAASSLGLFPGFLESTDPSAVFLLTGDN
jgi:hypothetical protein